MRIIRDEKDRLRSKLERLGTELAETKRERDEARAEQLRWVHQYEAACATLKLREFERDEARAELEDIRVRGVGLVLQEARRELDEARAELVKANKAVDHYASAAEDEARTVDELRARVFELEAALRLIRDHTSFYNYQDAIETASRALDAAKVARKGT